MTKNRHMNRRGTAGPLAASKTRATKMIAVPASMIVLRPSRSDIQGRMTVPVALPKPMADMTVPICEKVSPR